MKKWVCPVCGYVHEGDTPPEFCPQCKAPGSKFTELKESEKLVFADEHKVGIAKAVEDEEIIAGLKANFEGECTVGLYYEKAAWEEAEHAAKFAELLGDVVSASTKENLEKRVAAEHGATQGKLDLAKRAKQLNLDAIHDTVHEMAKDEARHGKAFEGLLNRYFK